MAQIHGPLMVGSRGDDVKTLQTAIGSALPAVPLWADGIFGAQTEAAVRAFQRFKHLRCDGIVGPLTAGALGLAYTTREALPRFAEITRRHVRAASGPGEDAEGGHEPPHAGPSQEDGAVGVLAAAVIAGFTLIHRRVKRLLKTSGVLQAEVQKRIERMLTQSYAVTVASMGVAASAAGANPSQAGSILSAGLQTAAMHYVIALASCSDQIQQSAPDKRETLRLAMRLARTGPHLAQVLRAVGGVLSATLRGTGGRLDVAVAAILSSMALAP